MSAPSTKAKQTDYKNFISSPFNHFHSGTPEVTPLGNPNRLIRYLLFYEINYTFYLLEMYLEEYRYTAYSLFYLPHT